jgi:hypothetical protein
MLVLDPSTGQLKTILAADGDRTDWRWISNGVAWGTGPSGGGQVFRLDISTGSVMAWVTPTNPSYIAGIDPHGFPLIVSQDPTTAAVEVWDGTSATAPGARIFASASFIEFGPAITAAWDMDWKHEWPLPLPFNRTGSRSRADV